MEVHVQLYQGRDLRGGRGGGQGAPFFTRAQSRAAQVQADSSKPCRLTWRMGKQSAVCAIVLWLLGAKWRILGRRLGLGGLWSVTGQMATGAIQKMGGWFLFRGRERMSSPGAKKCLTSVLLRWTPQQLKKKNWEGEGKKERSGLYPGVKIQGQYIQRWTWASEGFCVILTGRANAAPTLLGYVFFRAGAVVRWLSAMLSGTGLKHGPMKRNLRALNSNMFASCVWDGVLAVRFH